MDINDISKYRIKLCLFFIATVFYGAFVTINLLFGGMITPKPIKDIFINAIPIYIQREQRPAGADYC